MTITIQIGNTDDRLGQQHWANFYKRCRELIKAHAAQVHFSGMSIGTDIWQNACFVADVAPGNLIPLRQELVAAKKLFNQDSVAWTEGETQFI